MLPHASRSATSLALAASTSSPASLTALAPSPLSPLHTLLTSSPSCPLSHASTAFTKHALTTPCALTARSTASHTPPPFGTSAFACATLLRVDGRRRVRELRAAGVDSCSTAEACVESRGRLVGTLRRSASTSSSLGGANASRASADGGCKLEELSLAGLCCELCEFDGPSRRAGERGG